MHADRVDLHLHTTASDGHCSPRELVDRVAAAGLTVMAVTDHDTTAAWAEVAAHAAARAVQVVPGIEITAVDDGRDVHMLGYFLDTTSSPLQQFLAEQRDSRSIRVRQIGERLATLGLPIALEALFESAARMPGRSMGRPLIADAMIAAGYVADRREAFDRWLGNDGAAFVPRGGASPEHVIAIVHAAHGLVSLAHPGRTKLTDDRIDALRAAGLDAIEVYHSDHDAAAIGYYGAMAERLRLLVTGGSDYHGDPTRALQPGAATLPAADWARLRAAGDARG